MDFNFKNKVVLITGSSSGIGRGAAMAFAGKGAKVVLSSRNIVENKKLLDDIVRLGGNAIFVRTDVSNDRDVKEMVTYATSTYFSQYDLYAYMVSSPPVITRPILPLVVEIVQLLEVEGSLRR